MTLLSRLLARVAHLPPAETYHVLVERDLKIPMPDGVVLLADRYAPRGVEKPPLLLVRSSYGRRGIFGTAYGRLFAERGFQVVMQSIRGTFGSGGTLDPFNEHDDGLATVAWLKQQPWYPDSFMTTGPSYLGFVQWAIARDAGPDLKGMAIQESASEFRSQTYTGGAFALDATLSWTDLVMRQERMNLLSSLLFPASRRLKPLFAHLPLRDLDKLATGSHAAFFQEWLEHNEPGDPYWEGRCFDQAVKDVSVSVHMMAGWYDIFLPWQLRDYRTLRQHGQRPYLSIGPWSHTSPELALFSHGEVIPWLQAVARGKEEQYRQARVRVFVTGVNEWRDLADWPPPGTRAQRFHLQSGFGLAPDLPPASDPDHYHYDPADPTPSLAGPLLTGKAQPTDNRSLEARADVLTYTSTPLERELEVIGPVQADLFVQSNREHTDFFVRLCHVDRQGKSINVCDALLRVTPGHPAHSPDGTLHLTFDLWPTAHRFRAGHRLRVQVSSGAHPRYARNPGSGEPLGTATTLLVANQLIYHDPNISQPSSSPFAPERTRSKGETESASLIYAQGWRETLLSCLHSIMVRETQAAPQRCLFENRSTTMNIVIEKTVMVPMRDGVNLATDIYRPAQEGRFPVLLSRLPYNKELPGMLAALAGTALRAVQKGYVVVLQDCRGRFASEGEFSPPFDEANDGVDTVNWIVQQPWATGQVGMIGGSYLGFTQWLLAKEHPEALRAIAPQVTTSNYYQTPNRHEGGVFELGCAFFWSLSMVPEEVQRRLRQGRASQEQMGAFMHAMGDPEALLSHLPLVDQPLLREFAPFYLDWLTHPTYDEYWKRIAHSEFYEQMTVPALNMGGWYDLFLGGTLANYTGMKQRGAAPWPAPTSVWSSVPGPTSTALACSRSVRTA